MTEDHNPYAVLGVTPIATPAEINQAFRARLRALHPDTRHHDAGGAAGDTALRQLIAAYHCCVIPCTAPNTIAMPLRLPCRDHSSVRVHPRLNAALPVLKGH